MSSSRVPGESAPFYGPPSEWGLTLAASLRTAHFWVDLGTILVGFVLAVAARHLGTESASLQE